MFRSLLQSTLRNLHELKGFRRSKSDNNGFPHLQGIRYRFLLARKKITFLQYHWLKVALRFTRGHWSLPATVPNVVVVREIDIEDELPLHRGKVGHSPVFGGPVTYQLFNNLHISFLSQPGTCSRGGDQSGCYFFCPPPPLNTPLQSTHPL